MPRLFLCFALAVAIGCASERDTNPLSGSWRVDRTVRALGAAAERPGSGHGSPDLRSTAADCPSLVLAPLAMILRPGFEQEIDLGSQQHGTGNSDIEGNLIVFSTSELIEPDRSEKVIIMHELEILIGDDRLVGTASARGEGAQLDCRWELDAVATRASMR